MSANTLILGVLGARLVRLGTTKNCAKSGSVSCDGDVIVKMLDMDIANVQAVQPHPARGRRQILR